MRLAIILSLLPLLLFLSISLNVSFNSYFSQDDFYHLRTIMDKNISDIPLFFIKREEGQTFYRPLSRETYNLLMYKLYGLNPVPFHLVSLSLILVNIFSIFWLVKILTGKTLGGYFTATIYSLSSVHNIELYYLASIQNLLMSTLALLSIIFLVKFLKEKSLNSYLASILLFLLALFCHESAVTISGIIFLIILLKSSNPKIKLTFSLPFLIFCLLFILSIWNQSNLPIQQVYQPIFQIKSVLNTLGWFVLWSFGLPEILVDFIKPGLVLKSEFIVWYGYFARIVFPCLFYTIVGILFMIFKFRKRILNRNLLLFITFFLISISPFLFFPQHKFIYYLSFPIVWFSAALGLILALIWKTSLYYKVIALSVLISFIVVSYQTIGLNSKTYWAAKRAKSAEALVYQLRLDHPAVKKGSIFYIMDDPNYPFISKEWGTSSKQAFYILSGSDAVQLLYRDPSIKVYFESIGIPKNLNSNRLISFTAKFPY